MKRLAAGVAALVLAWVVACLGVAWRATSPARREVTTPPDIPLRAVEIADGGPTLRGWLLEPASPRATVVLAHGYRSDRRSHFRFAPRLAARGLRVVGFDFRAHGESEGERVTFGVHERGTSRAPWRGRGRGASRYTTSASRWV